MNICHQQSGHYVRSMLVLQMIYVEDDEYKHKIIKGFTQRYNVNKLIYFETFQDIRLAIARKKEIKKWRREKNKLLILKNPEWRNLSFNFE